MPEKQVLLKSEIQKIVKRDGRVVPFDVHKIAEAIFRAAEAVGGKDKERAAELAQKVLEYLYTNYKNETPTVENVQDAVEKILIEEGHAKTAKAYILYRHKKNEERQQRVFILGEKHSDENLNFSNEALRILERRYLLKDPSGNLLETPQQMLWRVAKNIAQADVMYGLNKQHVEKTTEEFYHLMAELKF